MATRLNEEQIKALALDELREYLIINDIVIEDKEDIKKAYLDMRNAGYFHKAIVSDGLEIVRKTFSSLADAYEKDQSIVESDLIFFGSRKVLEKMNNNKIKR